MHAHEEVPYRVVGMPRPIAEAWTRIELKLGNSAFEQISPYSMQLFMHPDRLIGLRQMVLDRPLISTDSLIQWGIDVDEQDGQLRQLYLEHQKKLKKNKCDKVADIYKGGSTINSIRKTVAPEKMKEVHKELLVAQGRRNIVTEKADASRTVVTHEPPTTMYTPTGGEVAKATLLSSSPLAGVRVARSASSKLNYILSDVRDNDPKFACVVHLLVLSGPPPRIQRKISYIFGIGAHARARRGRFRPNQYQSTQIHHRGLTP
jgi:hypothetical protein